MSRFIGSETIRISVIDTGCGIDPDEIQLLGFNNLPKKFFKFFGLLKINEIRIKLNFSLKY